MITVANLKKEYPHISQHDLPEALQEKNYQDVVEMLEFYKEDGDLRETVDLFVARLNEAVAAKPAKPAKTVKTVKTAKPKAAKPAKAVKQKAVKQAKQKAVKPKPKAEKPKAKPPQKVEKPKRKAEKPQASKESKPSGGALPVKKASQIPVELNFIKKFVNLQNRVKSKTQIYTLVRTLQKAIVEKLIRKTSPYASQIEYIQNFLVRFHNGMRGSTLTVVIPEARHAELSKLCAVTWADHVKVIRAFINILNATKTGLKEKARALLSKIENQRFPENARPAIASIRRSLSDYLSGKTDAPLVKEMTLAGLYGLAGGNGLGFAPDTPSDGASSNASPDAPAPADTSAPAAAPSTPAPGAVVSSPAFKNASFKTMGFTGRWAQLIGDPTEPFRMMIWGTGGSGKSTLAIELAKYIAKDLNRRVLYVANEEGAGATLHEKMTRLGAFHPNLFIAATVPPRLMEYDFVFIDSVSSAGIDLTRFEEAAKAYPRLSWALMFQTTKDGNFLGDKNWQHAVDVEIYTFEGRAKALKNRFGGKEEITVF
jgi:hypothetical protein